MKSNLFKRKPGGTFFGNLFRFAVSSFGGPLGAAAINWLNPAPAKLSDLGGHAGD